MSKEKIRYLVGTEKMEIKPLPIYSNIVCDFLEDLAKELRKDTEAKKYPDLVTFAYWCRKANITRLKEQYKTAYIRVGRGMVFHIAPSNVPINFAFSLVFGMLAGNANIVRVSEKEFPQTEIICRVINKLFKKSEYEILKNQTQIVSYGHEKEINDMYSAQCDVRVIWGGDSTIQEIRRSPIHSKCTEITFADRYSFAIFEEEAIANMSELELHRVVEKFYNDTYLMDQNACSSPHLILWKQNGNVILKNGRERFWNALYKIAEKYDLPEKKVLDKYTILCEKAAEIEIIRSIKQYKNLLYVVKLDTIPKRIDELRGKFGLFYEADLENIEEICGRLSQKVQTCVTFGIDNQKLLEVFIENHVIGIDRIVSVGEAMDIGVYWDGYDVIGNLSRGIILKENRR